VLLGGAAGEHVRFRFGERGEGPVRLALLRLPVKAIGALDHVASEWCAFLDGRFLFWRGGAPLWRFRTAGFALARHERILRQNRRRRRKSFHRRALVPHATSRSSTCGASAASAARSCAMSRRPCSVSAINFFSSCRCGALSLICRSSYSRKRLTMRCALSGV